MRLIITPAGLVRAVYDETLDLRVFGRPRVVRASHVEPAADGGWTADLSPMGGPTLGPFALRSEALRAERAWLDARWLEPPG